MLGVGLMLVAVAHLRNWAATPDQGVGSGMDKAQA
jgi:hypothetical protein